MPLIIENSWKIFLESELKQRYMENLSVFLKSQKKTGKIIYPKDEEIFRAFELTPLDKIKVVIIGQDPYHGPNQAHGLCFSVQNGVKIPPSLGNIYKELQDDLNILPAKHGNLTAWAKQGVLLLNSVLTVEQAKPAAHQNKGWEQFTDKVIELINQQERSVVFVLWGAYAQQKGKMIDRKKHLVIHSAHPSPLSAYRGFFGSHPFSQINEFLLQRGQNPIDWRLPELS
jgi:uracil-DNA glycosylase